MSDFDFLDKYQVAGTATARYTLYQLEDQPVLVVAPGTSDNAPFNQAMIRRSKATIRTVAKGGDITPEMAAQAEATERLVYGQHVIKGWEGMKTKAGKEIPFSQDAAVEFMQKIPTWIFRDLKEFCTDPRSFLEDGEGVDEEAVAGNS